MATDVIMPQMGESIAEGTITKWLVKVGDPVEKDEPLFEISTDKVDAEIPSPESGVLLEIKYQEGDTVPVDEVVAILGEPGEKPAGGAGEAEEKAAPEGEEKEGEETEEEKEEKEEKGEKGEKEEKEAAAEPEPEPESEAAAEAAADAEAEPERKIEREGDRDADQPEGLEDRLRRFSSPLVRRMAEEHDVDISGIEGSGIHGRVTKKDLESYLEAREKKEKPAPRPERREPAAQVRQGELVPAVRREPGEFSVAPYGEDEDVEIEPMSKIRQITAAHMIYSKATSAHVTTVFHMDLSRVARVRNRAKHGFQKAYGTKLTFMPFIFKAVAGALKAHPKLNSSVDGDNIVYKRDINLGMAVALDWGLIVPVIKNADELSLVGLGRAANDLAERARGKKLQPDEVRGGTFTVTNPGVFGSLIGTPIINQPQVAILGIGVIEKRPVVDVDAEGNDIIAIKTMSYFSISYDHRIVDGADADHFMNHVKRTLAEESWSELDAFE